MLYPVMLALLRLHRMKYSVQDSGRMEHLSMQVGQILELASGTNLGTHQVCGVCVFIDNESILSMFNL